MSGNTVTNLNNAAPANALAAGNLLPGFDDPVEGGQATFRAALTALAHPGRAQSVDSPCGVPPGLSPAMAALLLTLADVDTPVWLPRDVAPAVRSFVRFHCACPLVEDPAHARFVVVPSGFQAPALDSCDAGDAAYPDRSATLIIEVDSLTQGHSVTLSGPGIQYEQGLAARGLPDDFWDQWSANHRRFPLGVDALLTQDRQVCGLPRTTRVEV
jgi:alpha-D-ribose 1-methylphosphonate 5-triphosphate synthase subunit PhnH